jgi:5-methylcytosine-specific restriction endonuclease McrA
MPRKTTKKPRVAKTRGAGTLTEAAFWSMIRSTLRNKSRFWPPIKLCKQLVRRKYIGPRRLQKWEYQCGQCKNWFPEKNINVDHITPAGQLRSANDLPQFVETLFCEIDNLQVLCSDCHDSKTKREKNEQYNSGYRRESGLQKEV